MKKILAVILAFSLFVLSAAGAFAESNALVQSTGNVLVDNSTCYIEMTDMRPAGKDGQLRLELYIVNRSSQDFEYATDYVLVNSCITDSYLFNYLGAGLRTIDYITIEQADLDRYGITAIDELRIFFNIMVEGEEFWDIIWKGEAKLYPRGKTENSTQAPVLDFPYPQLVLGSPFFDMQIVDAKFNEDNSFYSVDALLYNKADKALTFTCTDMRVNDIDIEPYWYCMMPVGSQGIREIWLDKEQLASAKIDVPEKIEFTLRVYEGYGPDAAETPFFETRILFYPAMG